MAALGSLPGNPYPHPRDMRSIVLVGLALSPGETVDLLPILPGRWFVVTYLRLRTDDWYREDWKNLLLIEDVDSTVVVVPTEAAYDPIHPRGGAAVKPDRNLGLRNAGGTGMTIDGQLDGYFVDD